MEQQQAEEVRRAVCLVGPHRDDVGVLISGHDATIYASQGQQRTAVLALKLAEMHQITHKIGEPPVLLMDDVMAELDPKRQNDLLAHIAPDVQLFLTTTHLDAGLSPLIAKALADQNAMVFSVSEGHLSPSDERLTLTPEQTAC